MEELSDVKASLKTYLFLSPELVEGWRGSDSYRDKGDVIKK